MANFTVQIPATSLQEVIDTLTEDYQATGPGGVANPITKTQAAKNKVGEWLKLQLRQRRIRNASIAADPDITVT